VRAPRPPRLRPKRHAETDPDLQTLADQACDLREIMSAARLKNDLKSIMRKVDEAVADVNLMHQRGEQEVRAFPNHHAPPLRLPILVLTKGLFPLTVCSYTLRETDTFGFIVSGRPGRRVRRGGERVRRFGAESGSATKLGTLGPHGARGRP